MIEEEKGKIDASLVEMVEELCKSETMPQELVDVNSRKVKGLLNNLSRIIVYSRNEEINSEIFKLLEERNFHHKNSKARREKIPELILSDFAEKRRAHETFSSSHL